MKRVQNMKMVHRNGTVEWLMIRAADAYGRTQHFAYAQRFTPEEYGNGRKACAWALRRRRQQLRQFIATLRDNNKSNDPLT